MRLHARLVVLGVLSVCTACTESEANTLGLRYSDRARWIEPTIPWKQPVDSKSAPSRYLLPTGQAARPDSSLSPLAFQRPSAPGELISELRPLIIVAPAVVAEGQVVNYFFEFDTQPSFDSPNVWRYPMNCHATRESDLTSRVGYGYSLFYSRLRDVDATRNRVRFPFRVTTMRLPRSWHDLHYSQLRRQSQAIGWGLDEREAIREIYEYVRYHYYDVYRDSVWRPPIDTFRAGLGGCGHMNALAAAMLELNGIRVRALSGHNPTMRAAHAGAGHSACEVYSSADRRWSYFDTYLDVYLPLVGVADFAKTPGLEKVVVHRITEKTLIAKLGEHLDIGELFEVWTWRDPFGRAPKRTLEQLGDRHDRYGLEWMIDARPTYAFDELFAETTTVHVRARYIITNGRVVDLPARIRDYDARDETFAVSPWSVTSFVVHPRRMLQSLQRRAKR